MTTKSVAGKIVFVIDNLAEHTETVRTIHSLNLTDYAVVSCVRTALYDLLMPEMEKLFGDDFYEFDLDHLSAAEQERLITLFNVYGYWRELHRFSDVQKSHFIAHECASELRTVLLHFLDCQPIKTKIYAVFSDKMSGGDNIEKIRRLIITSQMLNLAGVAPQVDLLSDLLEFDSFSLMLKTRGDHQEFLRLKGRATALRSPILSEYIIQHILDGDFVINTLIDVEYRLNEIYDNDPIFRELMKTFVRYSFLEGLLSKENRRDLLIKYFENVKILSRFKTEPLFWLQYAIARLSLQEFDEAKLLFDAAYSYSKARGYTENRHLDNQFARYLLESRTFSDRNTDFMDAFNRAHQLLIKQMGTEAYNYRVYRVASNYYEFVVRRRDVLLPGDKVRISRGCAEILKKISAGGDRLRSYSAVRECEVRLQDTVRILQ